MGALRLDPAEHFQLERHGVAIGRGGRARVDHAGRAALAPLQGAPGFGELRDVLRAVAGGVGMGDVLRDHGLPGGGVLRPGGGEGKYLEPVEHRGFSHCGYTDA